VPRIEASRWLVTKMAEGFQVDAKMFAGLWFVEHGLPEA